ncbi:DUF3726 domain-containing protein [Acuticoccus mangrovi]|uniref:DUF3726 domain-containing protein n=1 Tax=Acuticoccus mangrovi TaxID=2796142 RepID=A0A934ILC2_9HYPH|nr:DUF3726 domain-containing protein [Acuticoccus mangrovi]
MTYALSPTITLSLSEIGATARKAARGIGMPWGFAEEASRATRALTALNLPGPESLLAALQAMDGIIDRFHAEETGGALTSRCGRLCPISAGAALSDRATLLASGAIYAMQPVVSPLLLLPFLIDIAAVTGTPMSLAVGMRPYAVSPFPASELLGHLSRNEVAALRVLRGAETEPGSSPSPTASRTVGIATWQALDRLASRTYVPATEHSRRAGAGAGTSDND